MINELTKEQKDRFPEFIKKWTDIGLSTKPANRKEAEEGIKEAYAIAGLEEPKIVWCDSPLSQGITRMIVQKLESDGTLKKFKSGASVWDSVWDSVRASVRLSVIDSVRLSVRDSVRDSVGDSVRASVRDSVIDSVRDSVGASVWDSVGASVWDSVWDSVWASVRDSVRDSVMDSVWASVRDSVWASVRDSGYGQHDANWLAFYDFFKEVTSLETQTEKLSGLWKIAKNAGWFLPHKNICWVSERHNFLARDNQGRLHCEERMACEYPDGWGIYALYGVRFDKELWEKVVSRTMGFKDVMEIENIEQRQVALKYVQPTELITSMNGELLDESERGNKLYLIPQMEGVLSQDAYYLVYTCPSTDRVYMSGIDPEYAKSNPKADACMSWKHNFTVEEYLNLKAES